MSRLLHASLLLLFFNVAGKAAPTVFPPETHPLTALADTIDPVIFCPGSQIINLAPMRCDTVLTYMVNAHDDQGQVIVIMLDGVPSGGAFPSGATVTTYLATDLAGNTATCSFTITALEPMTTPLCADQTTVLLDQNCSKSLHAFDIMEGGPYGCPLHYIIEIDKTAPFGNGPWVDADFGPNDINQLYQARVTALLTNVRCWGNVLIRDSVPPVINCQTINVPCAVPLEQLTPTFLRDSFGISIAVPTITDACGGGLSISFTDVLQNLPCDDTTTVSGIIRRIWSAIDDRGNTGTCEQIIRRHRLLANVQIPGSKTTNCQNPDLTEDTNGLPYLQFINRKYPITPNSYCEFDLQHFDTIQAGNCTGNYTVHRTWKIYDACLPLSATNPKIGVQLIEVKDNKGPSIACPGDVIITAPDNNCRASLDMPDVYMSDNCSEITSLKAFWTDSSMTKMLTATIDYLTDTTNTDTLGVFGGVASFPIGTLTMRYEATDACGKTGECTFRLTVANTTLPTVKCDSLLLVGLPTNGYLSVPAFVLDNGSSDDCSPLVFKARLLETNSCNQETLLSDTIKICCHNLGDTLAGTLRVYDIGVPAGTVANGFGTGHYTDCAFKIRVSGSNAPSCTAPANITVNCDAFDPTLEAYGDLVSQSCSVDSVDLSVNLSSFDTLCSRGTITRTFKVFSNTGQMAQCNQKIVVNYVQDYFVRFPDDVIVTACDTTGNYGAPVFFGQDCERLEATYQDERFTIVPDACLKIERTWKIINGCTYVAGQLLTNVPNPGPNPVTNHADNLPGPIVSNIGTAGDPWRSTVVKINPTDAQPTNYSIFYNPNGNGYQYKQIIKIVDTEKPVVQNCPAQPLQVADLTNNDPDLWNAPYWLDPVLVSSDLCENPVELSINASDACSGSNVVVTYQLLLDLNGDGVRETSVVSSNLPPSNTIYYNNASGGQGAPRQFDFRQVAADQKWRFAKEEVVSGKKRTVSVRFATDANPNTYVAPQLPYGNHRVKWLITDDCGNSTVCEYNFNIQDGKAPTIFCQNGVIFNILPSRSITVATTDLFQFAEDNCTPTQYLEYGIRKTGSGNGFPIDQNGNPIENTSFECSELGAQPVELWCRDKAGNAGKCTTTVNIIDNSGNCNVPQTNVDGKILTEDQIGIEGVRVNLKETQSSPMFPPFYQNNYDITDSLGRYDFGTQYNQVPLDLTVDPIYDADPLNGITTFDLVLISKHILGITPLGSPYKLIAADANKSNSVTTFDVVELRKLILGLYQKLPANTSWRFIDKAYAFPDTLNPFTSVFPSTIPLHDIIANINTGDFVGVKIGDVNNSVIANAHTPADDRSAGTLPILVSAGDHESVKPGEVFEVAFSSESNMLGCQFTLNYEGLEVQEVLPGANMSPDHFGLFPEKNALTVAWEKGGTAAFRLKCKALEAGNIREMLSLNSRITKAEGYRAKASGETDRYDLALQFRDLGTFELFQNRPNPFSGPTNISFNLPEASEATLKVFDANGRVLFTQSGQYTRGTHTITLEKSALEAVGILYYQLETPTHSSIKKMVKL